MQIVFFQRLLLILRFEINSLEDRCAQLAACDYPTDAAPALIGHLRSGITKARTALVAIERTYAADPKGAGDRLRSERRKLVVLLSYLPDLDAAQTRKVPWSLVPGIERLATELNPGRRLLIACVEERTYEIRYFQSPPPSSGIHEFDLLHIPARHRLNALWHVLVGHELFHPIAHGYLDSVQDPIVARLRIAATTLVGPSSGPLFHAKRLDQIVELLRYVWRRAMEELYCDLGCAALFGPAAVLSMMSFGLSFNLDECPSGDNDFYPPWRFRLRAILAYVFWSEGHPEVDNLIAMLRGSVDLAPAADALTSNWHLVRDEVQQASDLPLILMDRFLAASYAEVLTALPAAWRHIHQMVNSRNMEWHTHTNEIPSHMRRLSMLVPCGEYFATNSSEPAPSSFSACILAAWLYQIHHEQFDKGELDPVDSYIRTCRLLLKSLDDAELKRSYAAGNT